MRLPFDISRIEGFDWDEGNLEKNKIKHNVSKKESEDVFLNKPLRFFGDEVHSKTEKRYGALGKTNKGRRLAIFFTIRKNKIRVISARNQGKEEKTIYEEVERQFKQESEVK